ncbi:8249_t:CDS:2 [Ambispora gerdemannii]|uniref:8249_t:CDS:1 n=1 Tax=Ambispora gerdemannii TaxID=144530 RepID=A0A9N9AZ64_9GLOM|nr:8249_t:CDS:2 [Ambispora gerdemannii]
MAVQNIQYYHGTKFSIFFGSNNTQELVSIKASDIDTWIRSAIYSNFKHIRKDLEWGEAWFYAFCGYSTKG